MNPDAQRIAIAEACPFVEWNGTRPFWRDSRGSIIRFDPLNDLNAMHEAERVTFGNSNAWIYFIENLCDVTQAINCSMHDALVITNRATAAQRAEALLRTIGKWEDGAK